MKDLFEHLEELPPEVRAIVEKYNERDAVTGLTYDDCSAFLLEMKEHGYTFEFYLDAQPYNLQLIK